jgi:hypothetical protein
MTTIAITGKRLAAMYDNDMSLYVTPGAEDHPYWASRPNFRDDYGIASAQEVLDLWNEQQGDVLDIDDIRAEEGEFEVEVSTAKVLYSDD